MQPLSISNNRFLLGSHVFLFRGLVYQLPFPRRSALQSAPPRPADLPPHLRYADRDALNDDRYDDFVQDVALFEELGINVLWVYMVASGVSHSRCMTLLAEKGIYVFIGLPTPGLCINRMMPRESYTKELLRRYYSVVDAFRSFDNVAGFVVADQIVNDVNSTSAAEVVKAVVRDVKRYLTSVADQKGGRVVFVGVADSEWAVSQSKTLEYYMAGSEEERVDFYAFVNFSSWPSEADYGERKWRTLLEKLQDTPVPVVVSEYGSNASRPRPFKETRTLYGQEMRSVVSGGFAYEFIEAPNQYGLVKIEDGTRIKLPDFDALKTRLEETRLNENSMDPLQITERTPGLTGNQVPSVTADWLSGIELPTCPFSAKNYMEGS